MNPTMMYLFSAFAVVWLALFGYLLYLANRIGALQQQVELLMEEQPQERRDDGAPEPRRAAERA